MSHELVFVFIWCFIGMILSKKSCQERRVWKKDKKVGWSYKGQGSIQALIDLRLPEFKTQSSTL